ncbi:glycoside hydrolase family 88/105 protein [Flavobacterium sangjuense]|uniref:Unsaturated rhamnogalacturonyl hydrolase YteR n=1 Tax=Flavobacterium sangjuense TaxID=2518177 RepID=A0A4P7PVR3_9FLAO|nr:glycoside hydrolase family 88 protein [Flavobacterium sangjuense]QBZ98886.1 Unsaturated rhamnogalacturonyl hydrolase YteR [Flavobacterium sangjuense]
MKRILVALVFVSSINLVAAVTIVNNDSLKWSERMALSIMKRHPKVWQIDKQEKPKLDYKPTFVLIAFESLYKKTKNTKYDNYAKEYADLFIDSTGEISHYESKEFNIDHLTIGNLLFDLYDNTKDSRYLKAIQTLKKQIEEQPRTPSGGFWHKKIYPNQMWLDGIYMGAPFYTHYTTTFENGKNLDDVVNQFELIHNHSFDPIAKLPYHAWDESKEIAWANKETGNSPTIWSRGVGWYVMALVDALDYFPKNHPKYKELAAYLNEAAKALEKQQDASGLWYQITDKGNTDGNYLEASGTAMFAYTFAKGVNKGYLPKRFKKIANKAFDGLLKELVTVKDDEVHLSQISQGIGLGGNPFRDGSNKYYADSKKNIDNSVGVGAFILAALELNR